MKNNKRSWPIWTVRYWDHDPRINDCFGNSISWVGKARTENEAVRKAKKNANIHSHWFRVEGIKKKKITLDIFQVILCNNVGLVSKLID